MFFIHFSGIDNSEWPLINAGRMAIRTVFRGILSVEDNNHSKRVTCGWKAFTTLYRSNFAASSAESVCLISVVLTVSESPHLILSGVNLSLRRPR